MSKFKCFFGSHDFVLIANDHTYNTDYETYTKYWYMGFFQCKCCGKRDFKSNIRNLADHTGMFSVRESWISIGHFPENSYVFTAEDMKIGDIFKMPEPEIKQNTVIKLVTDGGEPITGE